MAFSYTHVGVIRVAMARGGLGVKESMCDERVHGEIEWESFASTEPVAALKAILVF